MRRCLRDPTFSRFDTIPECYRQTHTHTQTDTRRRHIPRLARRRAVKMQDTYHERKNMKGLVVGPLLMGGLGPGPPGPSLNPALVIALVAESDARV